MKKTFFLAPLFAAAVFGAAAHAATGDVIGEVYSTDIVTTLNGLEIAAANIGGTTMIALRDLEDFNFSVWFDEKSRSAFAVTLTTPYAGEQKPVERYGTVGEVIGNVYETDITAYVNGFEIPSVNIGGTTMVAAEALGDMTDSPFSEMGLSKYGFSFEWDEDGRRVTMTSFPTDNLVQMAELAADNGLCIVFDAATVDIVPSPPDARLEKLIYNDPRDNAYINKSGNSAADGRVAEMYYTGEDGEKQLIGIQYFSYKTEITDNGYGDISVNQTDNQWNVRFDEELMTKLLTETEKPAPLTYDEIMTLFDNGWNGYGIKGKFEADDYAVIAAAQTGLSRGDWFYAVFRVGRDGSVNVAQKIAGSDEDAYGIPDNLSFENGVLTYDTEQGTRRLDVMTGEVIE